MMSKLKNISTKSNLCSPLGVRGSFFVLTLLFLSVTAFSQTTLFENFKNPPAEAKPRAFWHWVQGAVSKEGIKADLIAMKEIGLEGPSLFTIRDPQNSYYDKPVSQLTPEWFDMLRYTMHICDSLGLKFSMHISDGFALAGGPWISPAESMQKVVFTDTIVAGGKINKLALRQPETNAGFYNDIDIYAMPVSTVPVKQIISISSGNSTDPQPFAVAGKEFRSEAPCYIQFQYNQPFTLKSIIITPSGNNIQSQRLAILASNDGIHFEPVKQLVPPRQGWQNYGFTTTYAVKPTTARYFRCTWTPVGTEPGSEDLDAAKWKPTLKIKAIELSETARIDNWEGKSGIVWRIAPENSGTEYSNEDFVPEKKIIRLKAKFIDGKLTCKLPKGYWRIVRMGHTSTGASNATGGPGKGLECDKFSASAVQKQFDNWMGAIIHKTDTTLVKRVMKQIMIDSWECGSQNWSDQFSTEFHTRRGYDLLPYLPVLAGFPIENAKISEQILFDVRLTISELVSVVFFKVMTQNAHKYGCELMTESVAPTFLSDGMQHFKVSDRPMGEFWFRSPTHDKPGDMLDAISGAHIYGKNIVQAEGFTQLRTNWDEDPAMIKPLLDRNFALGMNKLFFHVFVQNPKMEQSPGTTLSGMGLFFQRNQTWWKPGKAFVDYVARTQAMLQYGKPVVDVAVFTGEELPRRSITPDRLVPYLPGIIGEKRVSEERARLQNQGQPMKEMPAGVSSSANIFSLDNWVNPLNGYAYDSFNKDVLLTATARDGKMILADGAAYSVVIFPEKKAFSPETQAKIRELKEAGVAIPDLPYTAPTFAQYHLSKDLIAPENIAWTHRSGEMGDVYFIGNQENAGRKITLLFRQTQNTPTLWNPVNGEIENPDRIERTDHGTKVELTLAPYASTFVVFSYKNEAITKYVSLLNDSIQINGKWDVHFLKNNQDVKQTALFDWSQSSNPLIKYYSGTAIYKTTFTLKTDNLKQLDEHTCPVYLALGKVANLASVHINGTDCGTAWTVPYEVDITQALKKGLNTLEIEVTNTWANAINGSDKGTPPFSGIWTDGKYRMKEDKLLEAGLLGPVRIVQK